MKKLLILLPLLSLVFFSKKINAQEEATKEAKYGLMAGGSFLNHDYPISNKFKTGEALTKSFELGYIRNLHPNFNLLFPLQLGGAKFPVNGVTQKKNDFFGSLDALGQWLILDRSNLFSPFVVAGGALETKFDRKEDATGFGIPLGVGVNYNFSKNTSIGIRGEYRLGIANFEDHLQLNLGLSTFFNGDLEKEKLTDLDNDGIDDENDKCPAEAGSAELNGCPDTDGDGIANSEDACPNEFGIIQNNGCPILDTDNDGIPDESDMCPQLSGPVSSKGCPDKDGDGVPDVEDACPDKVGTAEAGGCPDTDNDGIPDNKDECPNESGSVSGCPDSDSDGIIDRLDKCPTIAGSAEANGCPEIKKEDQEILTFAAQNIQFETASTILKSDSKSVLDQIADILNRYPSHNVSIEGHTDSIGDAGSNLRLSKKRAKSCFDYLVKKGVSSNRMSHEGFGETQPIATNMYKDGRKQNRRVVFNLFVPK